MYDKIYQKLFEYKLIISIPVVISFALFIYSLIMLSTGVTDQSSYSFLYLMINMLLIIATALFAVRWFRYYKSINYVTRVFYRENPKETLVDMIRNEEKPSEKSSHSGMTDDYYDQTKRFAGILGNTDLKIMKKILQLLEKEDIA